MRGKRRQTDDVWNGHGGYMGIKKQKLVEQFKEQAQNEEKQKGIFAGVSIFVNGWTTPSADELKRIMMVHGGIYHHYYNSHKTTHIIASNLPDVKMRQLKGNEVIVKPEWITACLEAEKLVDYKSYLLFTNKSKANKITNFTSSAATNISKNEGTEEKKDGISPSKQSNVSPFKAKDAKDPKFLGEFFQNSRLHHISTMGANAKEYVNTLRDNHNGEFPAREKLKSLAQHQTSENETRRTVMHIDMDCFFVSVGLRNRPDLHGKPVAVCHAKGNKPSRGEEADKIATETRQYELDKYKEKLGKGNKEAGEAKVSWKLGDVDGLSSFSEIASCSYTARAKGVKNGMFLGPALKLCPDLQTIPYDFAGYEEVSKILYDTVAEYTLDIQAVSCDEMFVDLTNLLREYNLEPLSFVSMLRDQIKERTQCACSVGLGSNILLARMATKKAKPDGQFLLTQDQVLDYMAALGVKELPGVGRSLDRKLATLGIQSCGDMQKFTLAQLQKSLGKKTGAQMFNFCRGIDDRKLEIQQIRKTVSAEVNYGIRFSDFGDAERFLDQLATEVSSRLEKISAKGKSIVLKLMIRAKDAPEETAKFLGHGVCDNISRSSNISSYTSDKVKIYDESLSMLKQVGCDPTHIRGIGISMSKLDLEEKKNNLSSTVNNSMMKFMNKPSTSNAASTPSSTVDTSNQNQSNKPSTSKMTDNPKQNQLPVKEENETIEIVEEPDLPPLDQEVLASLPEDIRQEVLRDYQQQLESRTKKQEGVRTRARGNDDSSSNVETAAVNVPSTSKVTPQQENQDQTNQPISMFDEIDKSVFDALPADLKEEVLQQYKNKQQQHLPPQQTTNNQPQPPVVSPAKVVQSINAFDKLGKMSPGKHLVSPVVKRKRGRPPKNSVPSLGKAGPTKSTKGGAKRSLNVNKQVANYGKKEENTSVKPEETKKVENSKKIYDFVPSFCGKTELEEIRPLVKGWLFSSPEPMEDDVKMMVDYLQGLVITKQIHVVAIIFKCLFRNINKLTSDSSTTWKQTYAGLIDKVQTAMKTCYGHKLYIENTFDSSRDNFILNF